MIDNKLIEKALSLTGKSMEDMDGEYRGSDTEYFSIEKFYAYLLSPEFIDNRVNHILSLDKNINSSKLKTSILGWYAVAIYEYQLNNPDPLIELLSKIGN